MYIGLEDGRQFIAMILTTSPTFNMYCQLLQSTLRLFSSFNSKNNNNRMINAKAEKLGNCYSCTVSLKSRLKRFVLRCESKRKQQAVGGRPPRYAPPLCSPSGRRSASRGRADDNVAAVSHGQHVPTPTAAAA